MKASLQPHTLSRKDFLKVITSGAAGVLSAGVGSPLSLRAAVPPATEPLIHELTPYIRLYGATAAEIEGNAKLDNLKISVDCENSSTIKWNVNAPEEGEYDLFISCAVPGADLQLEAISGASSVKSDLKKTEGVYQLTEGGWYFNFDRKRLDRKLHLTRGINPVTLRVSGTDTDEVVRFRCLEVLPASAIAEMTAAEERARSYRARTDWFVKAGYGVMFHWTDFTQPRDGVKKPYPEAVNAFDVDAFAKLISETGAAYVIFTLNHAHPHCPAPIQSWEAVHPGSTTRRDLIGEIADALEKRDIRFLLYINSPVLTMLGHIGATGLYELTCSEEQFTAIHKNVLGEIGSRYRDKLAGYWFDSWYQSLAAYPDVPIEAIYRYCKIGNPGRIAAFNFWIFPVLTPGRITGQANSTLSKILLTLVTFRRGLAQDFSPTRWYLCCRHGCIAILARFRRLNSSRKT